jgi:CBS domain-containing protein
MKVSAVMTRDVGTCVRDQTLNEAVRIMLERDCGVVPILDRRGSRTLAGMVTDRDICIAAYTTGRMLGEISVGEVMAKTVVSCRSTDEIDAAEQTMQQAQVHRLPVVDASGQLIGMLSLADIARATARGQESGVTPVEIGETVTAIRRPRALPAAEAT